MGGWAAPFALAAQIEQGWDKLTSGECGVNLQGECEGDSPAEAASVARTVTEIENSFDNAECCNLQRAGADSFLGEIGGVANCSALGADVSDKRSTSLIMIRSVSC